MTRRERLIENYEDAYFALLMEDVIQQEGGRLEVLNVALKADDSVKISEELNKRCRRTIDQYFSAIKRRSSHRMLRKVLNCAAIIVAIATVMFTTAFAVSEEIRIATLNLIITVNEEYTQFNIVPDDSKERGTIGTMDENNGYFKDIQIQWIPDGYKYSKGEYNYDAVFKSDSGAWIAVCRFPGDTTYNFDTEDADYIEEVNINGSTGLFIEEDGFKQVALANLDNNIFIDITATSGVPTDVVRKFVENIFVI